MGYLKTFLDKYTRTIIWVAVVWWVLTLVRIRPTSVVEIFGSMFGAAAFAVVLVGVYALARAAFFRVN